MENVSYRLVFLETSSGEIAQSVRSFVRFAFTEWEVSKVSFLFAQKKRRKKG